MSRPSNTFDHTRMSRRSVLQLLAYGTAGAVVGCTPEQSGFLPGATVPAVPSTPNPTGAPTPAGGGRSRPDDRILVLIEQGGGLDALSTLAPVDHGAYVEGRGAIAHTRDELVFMDVFGNRGLHQGLAPLTKRGLAIVEGVGLERHFGSHFAAARHWYRGDRVGDWSEKRGILGRLSDELVTDQPIAGLTVSNGSPIMADRRGATRGLPSIGHFDWMSDPTGADLILATQLESMGMSAGTGPGRDAVGLDIARRGLGQMTAFREIIERLAPPSVGYAPAAGGRDLGDRLALASRLIRSDLGIRVFHIPHNGYDTHTTHRFAPPNDWSPDHDVLLGDFGTNVARFLDEMAEVGRADQVVVATFTEFGRRVAANHSGTDHGWASNMLLCGGPVSPGLHGADPGLDGLHNGNQRPTVLIDSYLGALAEDWLGVPTSTVLPRFSPSPLNGLFR